MSSQLGKHFDVIRKQNLKTVLKVLRSCENATKAELSTASHLSFPTVGSLIAELVEYGEVIHDEYESSTGGRRAERFCINPNNTLMLVIFIEAGSLYYRVYDASRQKIAGGEELGTIGTCLEQLLTLIEKLQVTYPTIKFLTLGLPGAVLNNFPFYVPNYPTLEGVDLVTLILERTGLSAIIENDVNCMVKGYALNQFEASFPDMVYIFKGQNGPGSGIISGGKVIRGVSGFAGELGFIPLAENTCVGDIALIGSSEEQDDAFGKTVAIMSCLLNPEYIVFSGIGTDADFCRRVHKVSESFIPRDRLPACLLATDAVEDYFSGLIDLGQTTYFEEIELN